MRKRERKKRQNNNIISKSAQFIVALFVPFSFLLMFVVVRFENMLWNKRPKIPKSSKMKTQTDKMKEIGKKTHTSVVDRYGFLVVLLLHIFRVLMLTRSIYIYINVSLK